MAWNADGTRMAWRMHSDYLRQLYLNNDLAEGRYVALGEELDLADITVPTFVGTETDHVAPWRSVYKVGRLIRSSDYTFCLTSGGHNAGIISGPSIRSAVTGCARPRRAGRLPSAEKFLQTVEPAQGSWWPTWAQWLKTHSTARKIPPPTMGAAKKGYKPVGDAPGTYVLVKKPRTPRRSGTANGRRAARRNPIIRARARADGDRRDARVRSELAAVPPCAGAGPHRCGQLCDRPVVAGAVTLGLIVLLRWRARGRRAPDWRAAVMLFLYMAGFSFAYTTLSAGTGALILFSAVQLTMFVVALRGGEHFPVLSWLGLAIAVAGLVYLVSPGLTAPRSAGRRPDDRRRGRLGRLFAAGRGAADPLESTANNFICAVPMVIAVSLLFINQFRVSAVGLALAVTSGAVTSGWATAWYAALRGLPRTRAATVQLSVPVIAVGGVALLAEPITVRLRSHPPRPWAVSGSCWLSAAARRRRRPDERDRRAAARGLEPNTLDHHSTSTIIRQPGRARCDEFT